MRADPGVDPDAHTCNCNHHSGAEWRINYFMKCFNFPVNLKGMLQDRMLGRSSSSVGPMAGCTCPNWWRQLLWHDARRLDQRGWVRVRLSDEDYQAIETCSIASNTPSMRQELDALQEKYRVLRDAMENQMRVEQDVLAQLVGDMADRQRSTENAALSKQGFAKPTRSTDVEEFFPKPKKEKKIHPEQCHPLKI